MNFKESPWKKIDENRVGDLARALNNRVVWRDCNNFAECHICQMRFSNLVCVLIR